MDINPMAAGLSKVRLERITHHLQRNFIEPGKLAGCQTLVARKGVIGYFSSLGFADLSAQTPVQDDTIFRIYSMSKPVTSVALMQLYERGLFQLNDPISRIIPQWRDMKVYTGSGAPYEKTFEPLTSPVTFRHILSHTAGLSYGNGHHPVDALYRDAGLDRHSGMSLQSFVESLGTIPLHFQPGNAWLYSYATDVCGYLVEALSGRSLGDYLRQEIFEPLEMHDTGFYVPEAKAARFAANYQRGPDKTLSLIDDPRTSGYLKPPVFESGGGGLVSTSQDYLNFCQMLIQEGSWRDQRILSRRTLALMTQNHLGGHRDLTQMAKGSFSETAYEGIGFGLGFAMNLSEVASGQIGAGDFYWGGAASTIFSVDPSEELAIIFMTQLMPSSTFNFRGQLKNIVYGAIDD